MPCSGSLLQTEDGPSRNVSVLDAGSRKARFRPRKWPEKTKRWKDPGNMVVASSPEAHARNKTSIEP